MKNYLHKITGIVLSAAVITSIAGCGGTGGETPKETASGDNVIKLFANFSPVEAGVSDQAFLDACEEATGIKIEFEIPPSTSYQERLQLMLASSEYADAILFPSTSDQSYLNAVSSGVALPVNEYLKNAPNLMEYTYDFSWDALKTNGDENIYGIPRTSLTRMDGFMVREGWLEKVGLSIPEDHAVTVEEFDEILKRFTKNDPDGNGKDDTFGITIFADGSKKISPIIPYAFGVTGWQKQEGSDSYMDLTYDRNSDAYKKALEYTASIFKNGYTDMNAATYNVNNATEKFHKGEAGVFPGFAGHVKKYEAEIRQTNPDAKVNYLFVKNEEGKLCANAQGTGMYGHWTIMKGCKNPENVIKVFDWMLSDEGKAAMLEGKEGLNYNIEDGKKVYTDERAEWNLLFVRRAGDLDYFINDYNKLDEDTKTFLGEITDIAIDSFIVSKDLGYVPPASKELKYINYKKTMDQSITKISTGDLPVSEYDKLLEGWYSNGGEEYVQEMNTYIKGLEK